ILLLRANSDASVTPSASAYAASRTVPRRSCSRSHWNGADTPTFSASWRSVMPAFSRASRMARPSPPWLSMCPLPFLHFLRHLRPQPPHRRPHRRRPPNPQHAPDVRMRPVARNQLGAERVARGRDVPLTSRAEYRRHGHAVTFGDGLRDGLGATAQEFVLGR